MREPRRHVDDGRQVPLLVRGLQVPAAGPVDGDGGLGVVPDVALALVEAVLRPDGQAGRGRDGDFGLGGGLDGGDLRLVAHLDADDGAELAAFGEAADEAVAEDVGEFGVVHLRDRVEGHLVGDGGGLVGHFDRDDVVEVGLVDLVLVDDGGAAGALDGAVFDRRARRDVERLHYVGHVVHHARGVGDDLNDVLVWRGHFGWADRCCGDGERVGTGGVVSGCRRTRHLSHHGH